MRAIYLKNLIVENEYTLKDESFHHLVHVTRVRVGEDLLLLNGRGLEVRCEITQISKRELLLRSIEHKTRELKFNIDVLLGMPKKEALDLCLKEVVELGINTTYLVRTQYSQVKAPEEDRTGKLLISALEQSNSPHLTNVIYTSLKGIDFSTYDHVVLMDSQNPTSRRKDGPGRYLLIIGPEGGFSPEEFTYFNSLPNLSRINLPTAIMRTPTALSCGVGIILQRLMD